MTEIPDPFQITDEEGDHLTVQVRYDGAIGVAVNLREQVLLERGEAKALAEWILTATGNSLRRPTSAVRDALPAAR